MDPSLPGRILLSGIFCRCRLVQALSLVEQCLDKLRGTVRDLSFLDRRTTV